MKKILEVNVDDLGYGGVYVFVKNLLKYNYINTKLQIDIAAIEEFENPSNVVELNSLGCNVIYVGNKKNKLLKQFICFYNIYKLVKEQRYESIHIHSDVANKQLVSGLAGKLAGAKKIIMHSHSTGVEAPHRMLKRIYHHVCRRMLKYIGTDFCACSMLAGQWMFNNISNKKIRIIRNGIDLNRFRFNNAIRERIRKDLKIEDKYVIGHVGRFSYQKNHEYLIKLYKMVESEIDDVVLLLIGEGPLESDVKKQVAELGVKNVIFYGVSNKVEELFQAMDVFVLPSRFEGFPIVGVEALTSGLPCIFSANITREIYFDGLYTKFVGIDIEDIKAWRDEIINIKEKSISRSSAYNNMLNNGFDINDSIKALMDVYRWDDK